MIMKKTTSYLEKHQDHIPYSFAQKFFCINDKFRKSVVLCRSKSVVNQFIEAFFEEYDYFKKVIKDIFKKNLSCLQKMKEEFRQIINVGYIKNYLLKNIKKVRDNDI